MRIALCYERVIPARGGAETYVCDLARRLVRDGHTVHLLASEWDEQALPLALHYHRIPPAKGPRFLRPWRFGHACIAALSQCDYDVSIGFDKTWGQDILYPQGGLHVACAEHNLFKYRQPWVRFLAYCLKRLDPAYWSYRFLEKRQYCAPPLPWIVVNSRMVQRHFEIHYGISPDRIQVIPSAIDSQRFAAEDRFKRRYEERQRWGVSDDAVVALFVAMNYRLKGLEPLLRALASVTKPSLYLVVVGNPRYRRYERQARRWGIGDRLRFLGPRQDPRDCFFAADFLVHPTFYDPCSLVVLEALACGLPVVTSCYNGAAELLHPPLEGLVVEDPHDTPALARALERMCDAAYRREAAAAARASGLAWRFEHHYQALMAVLEKVRRSKSAA
ncbi:MAG: glycosyl transferase family 1 [Gemmataceae bacterium]|uniref:Glycosyltransferase family 4 protein n=1 Tax=Thermogemmata fonticola TaxID=2755323 RepID=A0A7V8VBM5_9BACT|nr:glycosyltransferase family 4 protein [Thermogemmata fonticola]MBA2225071.1 glycosyltransferase family 4 protein [Thermogemmata fonticola]GIW84476.1 MAG: glycosyl transferase family 1 [Gemmataceae bacterium]